MNTTIANKTTRLNFQQKIFKVGFIEDVAYRDIESKLMITLGEYFNFSLEFQNYHNEYDKRLPNGTITGVVGHIMSGDLNFGVGGIALSYNRCLLVDFLNPHSIDYISYSTVPQPPYIAYDILVRPFTFDVWLASFITLILLFIFDQVLHKFLMKPQYLKHKPQSSISSENLLWINICLLFRQPFRSMDSMSLSMKICLMIWVFGAMILTNLYGGCLCSILTVPVNTDIDTTSKLADACERESFIIFCLDTTVFRQIGTTTIETSQVIYNNIEWIPSNEYALGKILNRKTSDNPHQQYGLIHTRERLRIYQLMVGRSHLYLPPDHEDASIFTTIHAVPYQKGFRYNRQFNKIVSLLTSAGIVEHWKELQLLDVKTKRKKQFKIVEDDGHDHSADENNDDDSSDAGNDAGASSSTHNGASKTFSRTFFRKNSVRQFTVKQLESIFLLYLISMATSILILAGEIISNQKNRFKMLLRQMVRRKCNEMILRVCRKNLRKRRTTMIEIPINRFDMSIRKFSRTEIHIGNDVTFFHQTTNLFQNGLTNIVASPIARRRRPSVA